MGVIQNIGYKLGLPGFGFSQPLGTPYSKTRTPGAVLGAQKTANADPMGFNYNPTATQDRTRQVLNNQGINYQVNQGNPSPIYSTSTSNAGNLGTQSLSTGGDPTAPTYQTPEGWTYMGTEADYMNDINNAYNAGMGYWNTAEQNLTKNLDLMKGQAESDYKANEGQLGATKQSTMTGLETQKRAGQTRKEDAMAAARRLFGELQQGNRQRFGGASSAGQAASEIQGAETQRQQGQTWRQANEFFQQVEGQKQNVESQYQAGLLQLQQAKQQALTNAQLEFNNSITQIAAGRAQTEQEKSQARLNALMDLRNKAFAIQQQDITFQQQLEAMKQQSLMNIQQYNQTAGGALTTGQTNLNQFTNATTLNPQISSANGGTATSVNNPYVGSIYRPKSLDDETGVIWG